MWRLTMRELQDQGVGRWQQLLWGMRQAEAEHYYDKFLRYMHGCELRLLAPDGTTARKSSS